MLRQVIPSLEMKKTSFTETKYFVPGHKIHNGTQSCKSHLLNIIPNWKVTSSKACICKKDMFLTFSPEIVISLLEAGEDPEGPVKPRQREERAAWGQQTLRVLYLRPQHRQHPPGLQREREILSVQEPFAGRRGLRSHSHPGQLEELRPRPVGQQRPGVRGGGPELPVTQRRGVRAQRGQWQGPRLRRGRVSHGLRPASAVPQQRTRKRHFPKIRERCNWRWRITRNESCHREAENIANGKGGVQFL